MISIVLIIPYFGKWPLWFDAYLLSVATNPTICWLCPTDCEIPKKHPANITFLPTTLALLNQRVNKIIQAEVPLNTRKFCDLKPAYAEIFAENIEEYDFWGICDMDIVWGDIRKFITPQILNEYDIISSRYQNISGHFTLFRNNPKINALYKQLPNYKALFEVPEFRWTDEVVLSQYLKENGNGKSLRINVYWPKILCNQENGRDSHQEYHLDKWLWKEGKMLELKNGKPINEVMYLHFINWKRTMRYCEVKYSDNPEQFFISYNGMHYRPHNRLAQGWNGFTNLFDGFYIREDRRIRLHKLKSIKKRFIRKTNKVLGWKR